MRTSKDITARILRLGRKDSEDFFGFAREALLPFIDYADARALLKEGVTEEEWNADRTPLTREAVLGVMRDYMAFAWGKAREHRGISAGRSVQKLSEWCWVLGDDEAVAFCKDDAHYPNYGAPILKFISERFGFPIPEGEDLARMTRGWRCSDDCAEGCGS